MDLLLGPLVDVFYFTIDGIKATHSFFTTGFHLSCLIGKNIVSLIVYALNKLCLGIQLSCNAAYILYEDYCLFITDFIIKLKWILDCIYHLVKGVCTCCQQMTAGFKSFCDSIFYYLNSNFEFIGSTAGKIASSIISALQILKQSLVFMGSSIWFLLSFIPLSIVYLCTLILCLISQGILELYTVVFKIFGAILGTIENCILFFSDVPAEAAFGLLLGSICTYFLLKNHSFIVRYILYIFSSLLRSGQIFSFIWDSCANILTRLFRRFRNAPVHTGRIEIHQSCNINRTCERNQFRGNTPPRSPPSEIGGKLCIVCQDLEKSVIILPCRHVCLCSVCCDIIEERYGRCPICRRRVERTMTVYI